MSRRRDERPASAYLNAAGVAIRDKRHHLPAAKPASSGVVSTDSGGPKPASWEGVSTDAEREQAPPATAAPGSTERPAPPPPPGRAPSASACEPYREIIEEALGGGRNAMAIYQDLVDRNGFTAKYASVKRFVHKLRPGSAVHVHRRSSSGLSRRWTP